MRSTLCPLASSRCFCARAGLIDSDETATTVETDAPQSSWGYPGAVVYGFGAASLLETLEALLGARIVPAADPRYVGWIDMTADMPKATSPAEPDRDPDGPTPDGGDGQPQWDPDEVKDPADPRHRELQPA